MTINYHGHSCFKLKGKLGTVITDPYESSIGFSSSALSADIVTVSHNHADHNAVTKVKGTSRRDKPFLIDYPGEYEVGGVSVFGTKVFHDDEKGAQRGENIVYVILLDGIRLCHLGDLGHELTEDQISKIGPVDVLFLPVGGVYTVDPQRAIKIARALDPSVVIPMHYKTNEHDAKTFGELKTVEEFLNEYGTEVKPVDKLTLEMGRLPEETELVVLSRS